MAANSSLIIKRYDSFGGNFIDSQYLGNAYETGAPHVFENTLMRIFSATSRFFDGKLVTSLTGGQVNGVKEIDSWVYRWKLQGAEAKSARIVENLESSNAAPGLNNTIFRIKLDLDFFQHPDVLLGEDNEYPLQIMDGPIPDGTGFIYLVRIQGDRPDVFVPADMLEVGKEFNKVWTSTQQEFNPYFGTQQYPSSFMLESQLGSFAQKYTVTDEAWRTEGKLAVEFLYTDRSGRSKKVSRFLPMAEALMWDNLHQSMEVQLVYGKKQTQPGKEKYWIKTGSGMREQLKDSWIKYYNGTLTVNLLREYLMDIFFARKNEADRSVKMVTGTLGSIFFHDALVAVANGFLTVDSNYIRQIPSSTDTPHLAYGAQFTRYTGPEGIVIDINKNSMYDSLEYCGRRHPLYPNKPIDSARMTFLDFAGGSDTMGDSNIMLLKRKDTFRWGYLAGTHTPTGPVKGGAVSILKAGYDVFCEGSAGLWIKDVTRCGISLKVTYAKARKEEFKKLCA